ncbi:MAG TPA: substrate-binding domain-containing protein, partial [Rubrivivax sp.]|nr:substrate-binding domain-containing protein [Rubrivivax sp.]
QQAEWGAYHLTTVEQNVSQMIEATVKMLLQQLEDDAVTRDHAVIPARLVVRSSARVPATGASA